MKRAGWMAALLGGVLVLSTLAGCGGKAPPPTIDATTPEKLETSIKTVRDALPAGDREAFDDAVRKLTAGEASFFGISTDPDAASRKALEHLHGKTGREVIEAAAER